jgi:hypothetical protein
MNILEMSNMIQAKRLKVYPLPHCAQDLPTYAGFQPFCRETSPCTATAKELRVPIFSDVRKLCQLSSHV